DATQEAQLGAVHVADAGHDALIEQGHPDGAVRVAREIRRRALGIPVGAEQIRPEMPHCVVLPVASEYLDDAELEPHGLYVLGAEHDACLVSGLAPACSTWVDVPFTFHLQVRMDRDVGDADE